MGLPDGKSLEIDSVSQNRLNPLKYIKKFDLNSKKTGPRSHLYGLPPEIKYYILVNPNQRYLKT